MKSPRVVHNPRVKRTITLDGRTFSLLREQRSGLALYKSEGAYARIGPPERIKRDLETHQAMQEAQYPVAKILAHGTTAAGDYFIEEALGNKTFRTLFEEDIEREGTISEKNFADFVRIVERHLIAQSRSLIPADSTGFARGVHLEVLCEELSQYCISLPDKFQRVLQKLVDFPYVLSHGDFNPANIFPAGVIDFEDAFPGPFGFDAVAAVSTVEWFPESDEYEYFAHYRFTDAQKETYLAMCDTVSVAAGHPKISAYYDDFAFCRAMWSVVRMHGWPKLQAWRYNKFIKTYLYN